MAMPATLLVSIIDDDASAREALAGLVRAMGFDVAEFAGAAAFLKSAQASRTACLIADMWMPDMTGLDLHHHLIAVGTPIPTVLVTAYPDEAVRARAWKAGIRCYLAKPLAPDALLRCIRSALEDPAGGTE